MRRPVIATFLALAAVAVALASAGPPKHPGSPAPGPGGVYSLHVQLFRAIDDGDGPAVEKLLGGRMRGLRIDSEGRWSEDGARLEMYVLGPDGTPVETDDAATALKLLIAQDAVDGSRGRWTTRILEGWMDCPSAELSYATLAFERTREVDGATVRKRYRSTSLVSYEDGAWRLWHFHVSPAGE